MTEYGKIMNPKDLPPKSKHFQKISIVPEILKTIPKGKMLEIVNTYTETPEHKYKTTDEPRITTIRSYIEKAHKTGKLTQYQIEQRTEYPNKDRQTRLVKLYIIHN